MDLFENGVGRPSNETIKKRNIFKGVCVLLVLVVICLVAYILNDKGIITINGSHKANKNSINQTTKKADNKDETTTIYEKLTTFVEKKSLNIRKNEAVFDMSALKQIGCSEAISAGNDEYHISIYTFKDESSAKDKFNSEKEYQKTAKDYVSNVKILTDKSENDYEIFEIKDISENPDFGTIHDYYYGVRISNYYISLFSAYEKDNSDSMIKLKNELNTVLNIK